MNAESAKDWFRQPGKKQWSPCRCCGCRDVVKSASPASGGRVWIMVECPFCETRRGGYYRKEKKGGA